MVYKINYELVDKSGKNISQSVADIRKSQNELKTLIENLGSAWQGVDYENFKSNSTSYVSSLDSFNADLDFIGRFMQGCANTNRNMESEWDGKVKLIGSVDEK